MQHEDDAVKREGAAKREEPSAETVGEPNRVLGYGHKAHSPDPEATYGFDPGPNRLLPRTDKKRWRVTG